MRSITMLLYALLKCQGGKCTSVHSDTVSGRHKIHRTDETRLTMEPTLQIITQGGYEKPSSSVCAIL